MYVQGWMLSGDIHEGKESLSVRPNSGPTWLRRNVSKPNGKGSPSNLLINVCTTIFILADSLQLLMLARLQDRVSQGGLRESTVDT
jgi:hypothetical protein